MKATDVEKILDVVNAFNNEKDYYGLLGVILDKMMELTAADAGTLYVVEGRVLHFRIVRNKTLGLHRNVNDANDMPPIVLDEDNIVNVSAYVAIHNEIVSIDDVYSDARFNFAGTKKYDAATGYHSHSMLVFPLTAATETETEVIGVIQLINSIDSRTGAIRSFKGIIEPSILPALAKVSAAPLANMLYIKRLTETLIERERIRNELAIAQSIQSSVLPHVFPERKEFDIYAFMRPAKEVGGDFYDFFFIGENTLAVVMADVSGKGVPAALFMVIAKALIKNNACGGKSPAEVFETVNKALCENNDANMFVTAFMGYVDLRSGRFVYVNAGHNPPLIRRGVGNYEFFQTKCSFVLAGFEGIPYKEEDTILRPGDRLYLYTDGVTEAMNKDGALYSDPRLLEAVNQYKHHSPRELLASVKNDVDAFVGDVEQADDMTMLSLEIK